MPGKRSKKTRKVESWAGSGNGRSPRRVEPSLPRPTADAIAALGIAALYALLLLPAPLLLATGKLTAAEMLEYVEDLGKVFLAVLVVVGGPRAAVYLWKRLGSGDHDG